MVNAYHCTGSVIVRVKVYGELGRALIMNIKHLWEWFRGSHFVVKAFVYGSLIVILGNLAFIVYANNYLSSDNKSQGPRSLTGPEYEKAFIDQYDKWMATTNQLLYLVKDGEVRNDDWKHQVAIQITQMKTLINQERKMVPPKEYVVIHSSYKKAISEFSWAADNLSKSIANQDQALLNKCIERVVKGRSHLVRALNTK